jgi:HTH-type transcriptional regulator/antitoxin HigA
MMQVGAIPKMRIQGKNKDEIVYHSLVFFGVASPDEYRSVYVERAWASTRWRIEQQRSDPAAAATWLRLGELAFQRASLSNRFDAAALQALLPTLRTLTVREPDNYLPSLVEACARVGLVLAYVPPLPRARVSGAARWLNGAPLIQLSLYGRKNDRFWFTFFHEVRHIVAHERGHIFMDEWDGETESDEERDADDFARDFLIAPRFRPYMQIYRSETQIVQLAQEAGVHPGIVVGRMQHDGYLPQKNLNKLKQTFPAGIEHVF